MLKRGEVKVVKTSVPSFFTFGRVIYIAQSTIYNLITCNIRVLRHCSLAREVRERELSSAFPVLPLHRKRTQQIGKQSYYFTWICFSRLLAAPVSFLFSFFFQLRRRSKLALVSVSVWNESIVTSEIYARQRTENEALQRREIKKKKEGGEHIREREQIVNSFHANSLIVGSFSFSWHKFWSNFVFTFSLALATKRDRLAIIFIWKNRRHRKSLIVWNPTSGITSNFGYRLYRWKLKQNLKELI